MVNPMSESYCDVIGNTSLVKLTHVTKGLDATIAVKLEYQNPTCSVKDRPARCMIEEAEKAGQIISGKSVLVEGTSGNMGISISAIAVQKGYKCVLVMPSSYSIERRAVMASFGAVIVLTNPEDGVDGVIEGVERIADVIPDSFKVSQFSNPNNPLGHYRTTGPEIWQQTNGKVDVVVFGIGTGGTVTGVGRYLKEKNENIKVFSLFNQFKDCFQVYGVEPYESSVLNGFPAAMHKIQGIGAGFIPPVLDLSLLNEVLRVKSDDAIEMARRLATEEGIMGGISSGANVCAAIQLASRPENKGKLIVTNVNSFGERYLSTDLFSETRAAVTDLTFMSPDEQIAVVKKALDL